MSSNLTINNHIFRYSNTYLKNISATTKLWNAHAALSSSNNIQLGNNVAKQLEKIYSSMLTNNKSQGKKIREQIAQAMTSYLLNQNYSNVKIDKDNILSAELVTDDQLQKTLSEFLQEVNSKSLPTRSNKKYELRQIIDIQTYKSAIKNIKTQLTRFLKYSDKNGITEVSNQIKDMQKKVESIRKSFKKDVEKLDSTRKQLRLKDVGDQQHFIEYLKVLNEAIDFLTLNTNTIANISGIIGEAYPQLLLALSKSTSSQLAIEDIESMLNDNIKNIVGDERNTAINYIPNNQLNFSKGVQITWQNDISKGSVSAKTRRHTSKIDTYFSFNYKDPNSSDIIPFDINASVKNYSTLSKLTIVKKTPLLVTFDYMPPDQRIEMINGLTMIDDIQPKTYLTNKDFYEQKLQNLYYLMLINAFAGYGSSKIQGQERTTNFFIAFNNTNKTVKCLYIPSVFADLKAEKLEGNTIGNTIDTGSGIGVMYNISTEGSENFNNLTNHIQILTSWYKTESEDADDRQKHRLSVIEQKFQQEKVIIEISLKETSKT